MYLTGMRRSITYVILFALLGLLSPSYAVAAAKAGASCPKLGKTETLGGKKFTCIKSGKKLVWNKGVATKDAGTGVKKTDEEKSSASAGTKWPVPSKLPSSFADLYENREGIAYSAWLKTAKAMSANAGKIPPLEVLIGPNTKPWSSNHEEAIKQVSQAFPNQIIPKKLYVIFYNFTGGD